ncbi:hypothetical protein PIB30_042364 [Stylosanthes scabra]|uniref:Uncharacterized protein n=1 Tax=Stylosanthes scabra TaxID=79078 RepID=A0ABU6UIE0_9FABA|nr:hypothetical protein [Stylosanthes scabra]
MHIVTWLTRRAQFRPPGERRPRIRGRGLGCGGKGEAGQEPGVADDGYVPLGDDQLGGDVPRYHRQAARGEVCYSELAAIWAQEDGEGIGSHTVVGTPEFHVDLNEPANDFHDVYFSLGGTPPFAYLDVGPSIRPPEVPQSSVQEPTEDEDYVPLVRHARRVPRRRRCGTSGHI